MPLLLASIVYGVMWIWHRGAQAVQKRVELELTPLSTMIDELNSGKIARVPGSAVFFTRAKDETSLVMSWHVRHNRSLHEHVLALTMTVVPVPRVDPDEELTLKREGDHFWRAELKIGFMEHPDIPEIFGELQGQRGRDRRRRRDLLRRLRNHRAGRGRQGPAPVAGGSVRRDGPQRRPHERLSSVALRSGG